MQLFFQKFGQEGTPLVLLHGLFGMSDNWAAYGKRLAQWGYTVYIPDQRNHGRSPHHHVFNYLALTDDLADFIEQLDLDSFVLMGHSMGGKVAMRYALENPEQIQRLIVVDISMRSYQARDHHKQMVETMLHTPLHKMHARKEISAYLKAKMPDERLLQFMMKNLKRTPDMRFDWKLNTRAIYQHLDQMFDGIESPTAFDKPSLFIRGGDSNYVSEQDLTQIGTTFTNNEIQTIPQAGHWVHVDQAQTFSQHLHHFLTQ